MTDTRKSPDVGCLVDGNSGHYALGKMVRLAAELGYPLTDEEDRDVRWYYDPEVDRSTKIDCLGNLVDIMDRAEAWLNDNVAREGFVFAWIDGDFIYLPISQLDE